MVIIQDCLVICSTRLFDYMFREGVPIRDLESQRDPPVLITSNINEIQTKLPSTKQIDEQPPTYSEACEAYSEDGEVYYEACEALPFAGEALPFTACEKPFKPLTLRVWRDSLHAY